MNGFILFVGNAWEDKLPAFYVFIWFNNVLL